MSRHWRLSVAVVLLLALGSGAATVMLSFAEAVLFRPLAVQHPEQLARVVQQLPRIGILSSLPEAYLDNLRARSAAFAFVFGETGEFDRFAVTSPLPAERVSVRGVTPDFFRGLGVQPRDGHLFDESDSTPSAQSVPALLSYRLWQRRFDEKRSTPALGQDITINDHHFTVVGIMSEDFRGLTTDTTPDVWIPLSAFKSLVASERPLQFQLAARLKPGVSLKQAEVECQTVWQSTMMDYYRNIEHESEQDAAELVGQERLPRISRARGLRPAQQFQDGARDDPRGKHVSAFGRLSHGGGPADHQSPVAAARVRGPVFARRIPARPASTTVD